MIETLKKLTLTKGVSGDEDYIRKLITYEIKDHVDAIYTDNIGNLIAFKKGIYPQNKKLMLAAHMDEVGLIIKKINDDGYLSFAAMGGIDKRVLLGRRVLIGDSGIVGVIGTKAVHQQSEDERKKAPDIKKLYIDIGAKNKEEAEKVVSPADTAVFDSDFIEFGDGLIKAKALDNRAGCLALIEAAKGSVLYDTYFVFTVLEETGTKGAYTAAFSINPDLAVVVDTTTAADFEGVKEHERSTKLGEGTVIFLIEGTAVYKRTSVEKIKNIADKAGVKWQHKNVAAGGLDSGAIQRTKGGIETVAIATPCRYLHSPSCVISKDDLNATVSLVKAIVTSPELLN